MGHWNTVVLFQTVVVVWRTSRDGVGGGMEFNLQTERVKRDRCFFFKKKILWFQYCRSLRMWTVNRSKLVHIGKTRVRRIIKRVFLLKRERQRLRRGEVEGVANSEAWEPKLMSLVVGKCCLFLKKSFLSERVRYIYIYTYAYNTGSLVSSNHLLLLLEAMSNAGLNQTPHNLSGKGRSLMLGLTVLVVKVDYLAH